MKFSSILVATACIANYQAFAQSENLVQNAVNVTEYSPDSDIYSREEISVKTGISIGNGIIGIIDKVASTIQGTVCRREAKGRGVGTVLVNRCESGEEPLGALCYPKCKEGYENVLTNICRKKGCGNLTGATDIGISCSKPAPYRRGKEGYAIRKFDICERDNGKGNCEKKGLMWYPKCKPGFHSVGCCFCSPDCPEGYADDGQFCRKDHYGRGVGVTRLGCPDGKEKDAALCYPPCPENTMGLGPLCWNKCSGENSHRCGLFCTSSPEMCAATTVRIVGTAASVTLSAVSKDAVGAIKSLIDGAKHIISIGTC